MEVPLSDDVRCFPSMAGPGKILSALETLALNGFVCYFDVAEFLKSLWLTLLAVVNHRGPGSLNESRRNVYS